MKRSSSNTLLSVNSLKVRFPLRRSVGWGQKQYLNAVDDVSFAVNQGQTLAIVGESGSGKTTTARAIARLVKSWDSQIILDGQDITDIKGEDLRTVRQKIQLIFQDPYSSLNPRQRAASIVREPLDSLTNKSEADKQRIVDELFEAVGLRSEQKQLFPHQFSGGQRQRIGIARALATYPKLIICDEPVSALDVAVQAQILNLLRRLQKEFGLTYLFISHDLGVVQYVSDAVAVMYMGKIVEIADRVNLFNNPAHPYTQALLAAVPSLMKSHTEQPAPSARLEVVEDSANSSHNASGCRFAGRCPLVQNQCLNTQPQLRRLSDNHQVACHLA